MFQCAPMYICMPPCVSNVQSGSNPRAPFMAVFSYATPPPQIRVYQGIIYYTMMPCILASFGLVEHFLFQRGPGVWNKQEGHSLDRCKTCCHEFRQPIEPMGTKKATGTEKVSKIWFKPLPGVMSQFEDHTESYPSVMNQMGWNNSEETLWMVIRALLR